MLCKNWDYFSLIVHHQPEWQFGTTELNDSLADAQVLGLSSGTVNTLGNFSTRRQLAIDMVLSEFGSESDEEGFDISDRELEII